uniref:Nuclear protein localization protein 4 n=2 Tax=Lygus hesperus TaxID=30085 RepID=A0A0A9YRY3_LYGHE
MTTTDKVFCIRVRDPLTMRRIYLPSPQTSKVVLEDLQEQIQQMCNIPIKEQILSKDAQYSTLFTRRDALKRLQDLQIYHGDILYVKSTHPAQDSITSNTTTSNVHTATAKVNQTSATTTATTDAGSKPTQTPSTVELTPQCQHGRNGRCLHCFAVASAAPPSVHGSCNHGPNVTCIHCSAYIKEHSANDQKPVDERSRETVGEWLCTHPPNVFCVKCIPPDFAKEEYERHKKIDIKPFKKIVDERRALCKFRHPPTTVCVMCAPPALPSYVGKPHCDGGHPPWPRGVCVKCAPPSAVIRAQEYRHVDGISLPQDLVAGFYRRWSLQEKREVLKAGLLFGH